MLYASTGRSSPEAERDAVLGATDAHLKNTEDDANDLIAAMHDHRGDPDEASGRYRVDVFAKRDNLHAVTSYRVNRQEGFAKGSGALCATVIALTRSVKV